MYDIDDLTKACELIVEELRQLGNAMKEIFEDFREIFTLYEECNKRIKNTSPKVYGMTKVSKFPLKARLKSYDYTPVIRKNLPYQRRRF